MRNLNNKFINGTLWSFTGQIVYSGIVLLSNIILTKYITPSEFGSFSIAFFFIVIANILIDGGLGGALIRKENITEDDYSTVFIFNLTLSLCIYVLIFIFSGYISDFYNDKKLSIVIKLSCVVFIFNAFQITQITKLIRNLEFKKKTMYTGFSMLIASVTGVYLAVKGFGIFALIATQLINSFLLSFLLFIFEGSFGRFIFSKKTFRELFSFGAYTTTASILNTIFENINQLILGKILLFKEVGFYYQAKKLQDVPVNIIHNNLLGVVYAYLSKLQKKPIVYLSVYNDIAAILVVVMGLVTVYIYIYSDFIILNLYGIDWIESSKYLKILSVSSFFYILEMLNRVTLKVFNNARIILNFEIFKKILHTVGLLIVIPFKSIEYILWNLLIISFINYLLSLIVSSIYTNKKIRFELVILFKTIIVMLVTYLVFHHISINVKHPGVYILLNTVLLVIIYFFGVMLCGLHTPFYKFNKYTKDDKEINRSL